MAKRKARRKRWDQDLVRPTPIDGHVGARVRQRRTLLGMSQQALAAELGITFQQLQKNERGINRIASSRLVDLSRALDVPIQFFFDDMPAAIAAAVGQRPARRRTGPGSDNPGVFASSETLKLVRAYYRIQNPRIRKRVYALAKTLAADGN